MEKHSGTLYTLPYGVFKINVIHRGSDTWTTCMSLSWKRRTQIYTVGSAQSHKESASRRKRKLIANNKLLHTVLFVITVNLLWSDDHYYLPDRQAVESIHFSSCPTLSSPQWLAWHGNTIWLIFTSVGFLYTSPVSRMNSGACTVSASSPSDVMMHNYTEHMQMCHSKTTSVLPTLCVSLG